jgi:hypothetical protein
MELQKEGIVVSEVYRRASGRTGWESPARGPAGNYSDGDTPEFVAGLILKAIEEGAKAVARPFAARAQPRRRRCAFMLERSRP